MIFFRDEIPQGVYGLNGLSFLSGKGRKRTHKVGGTTAYRCWSMAAVRMESVGGDGAAEQSMIC